ncbi:MAG: hypothetical protein JWQ71_3393 [Pedosphaera sp.]|nr:hypothetical protein [Pedosphaera sp.]
MKRIIVVFILIVAVIAGVWFWKKSRGGTEPAAADHKPAAEEPHIKTDTNGNITIKVDEETQKRIALKAEPLAATNLPPEVKGFGRVLDPAPLAGLINELASAQAAFTVSSKELERLKILKEQGNTSERALQAVEAAAARDRLLIQSAKDRLELSWGKIIVGQNDLTAFVQSLTSLETALVRVDLPAGQALKSAPANARIISLSGSSVEAQLVSMATGVDPQTQGQGFIFAVKPNEARLRPGEAVTGYLKVSGEPLAGVVIPRDAVVRTEGQGWVYVQTGDEAFTRKEIVLDHPVEGGWFLTKGVAANDRVVVIGSQSLLSEELKPSGKPE